MNARVRGASTCTIEGLGVPHSVACRHGRVAIGQHIAPNDGTGTVVYRVRLVASKGRRRTASAAIPVMVAGNGPPPPSGSFNLYACQPGPECDYGSSGGQFSQISGQVLGEKLPGESAIDAAADWEYVVLHIRPEEQTLGSELEQAGGPALTLAGLIGFWRQRGIQGVGLQGATLLPLGKSTVLAKVKQYGVLLAEFSIGQGWGYAFYVMTARRHVAPVIGFTPRGPIVVSWGQVMQLTWQQWDAEAQSLYAIAA